MRVALKSTGSSSGARPGPGRRVWPSEDVEYASDSAEEVGDVGRGVFGSTGAGREAVTTTGIGRELGLVVSLASAADADQGSLDARHRGVLSSTRRHFSFSSPNRFVSMRESRGTAGMRSGAG